MALIMDINVTKLTVETVVELGYCNAVKKFAKFPSHQNFMVLAETARALNVVKDSSDASLAEFLRGVEFSNWCSKLGVDYMYGWYES